MLFADAGHEPNPEVPRYREIQEGLGLYGRTSLERCLRKVRRGAGLGCGIVFTRKLDYNVLALAVHIEVGGGW